MSEPQIWRDLPQSSKSQHVVSMIRDLANMYRQTLGRQQTILDLKHKHQPQSWQAQQQWLGTEQEVASAVETIKGSLTQQISRYHALSVAERSLILPADRQAIEQIEQIIIREQELEKLTPNLEQNREQWRE